MEILEFLKVIFLGIVEGITEWLPISSTGHMILVNEFLRLNVTDAFKEMFFVVIQLGAILAVVILFFNKLNPFSNKKDKEEKKSTISLWIKVLIASIPAGVIGLLFNDKIDELFYNYTTVSITLVLYGVLFIIMETWNQNRKDEPKIDSLKKLTYKSAFFIGIAQILALIPGTSRSGATILGAMLLGTSRSLAAEFSFFLAIPVMFGASAYKLLKFGFSFTGTEIAMLAIGMIVAFIVSIIVIKLLMEYIKKHDFKAFGYYRMVLGIVILAYFVFV